MQVAIMLWLTTTAPAPVLLTVDPTCTRSIAGISELRREAYFGLCDAGTGFDRRCRDAARYRYLVQELGITFGRRLGVVQPAMRWDKAVREDPARPGFADLNYLRERLRARGVEQPGDEFRQDMGGRLDIAAHGQHNGFPEFLGVNTTPQASQGGQPEGFPKNLDGAAELSAAVLKYAYGEFDRPAYYELVNEPHWSFWPLPEFAQWHLKTRDAVHAAGLDVQVGGPCLSVAYYYKKQYGAFNGLRNFIDATGAGLDFYSFHAYDFLRERDGDFGGRITSGAPLESVLDLVSNYTANTYGREVPLVLSEHGAYGAMELVDRLAHEHFPGEGFDWEMRKRSIDDFNMVSGVIANTMVFMDHPHVVRKAVPFILLESMAWDPRYYATLYVPDNFEDRDHWIATQKVLFYKLMREVRGRRVVSWSPDPDIQLQAFLDGQRLYVLLNNLSHTAHPVRLSLPAPTRVVARRVGRNPDYTPYYHETPVDLSAGLALAGREAVVLVAEYDATLAARAVDERPCYGDRVAAPVEGVTTFQVDVPRPEAVAYATLRVGLSRPGGTAHAVEITLNGEPLAVAAEDAVNRIDNGEEYATCKQTRLQTAQLRPRNTVAVRFPDGQPGAVGAVVIRAAWPAELP